MPEARVAAEKKQRKTSSNAKELGGKKQHMRTQGIQGPVSMSEADVAGEKKQHTRHNEPSTTKRTTQPLRTRTSSRCSNASMSRSVDLRHCDNTAAAQEQRQSASMKIFEDMDYVIQKMNELGLGEDISFEEYYGYLTQLPLKPLIDSRIKLDPTDRYEMDIRHAVYRIKSFKVPSIHAFVFRSVFLVHLRHLSYPIYLCWFHIYYFVLMVISLPTVVTKRVQESVVL
jgi:hypothetical protein